MTAATKGHLAQRETLPVVQQLDRELGLRTLPVGDDRAGAGSQLQVPADEVGVNVGLDHPLDQRAPLGGLFQVDADVTARIHDDRPAGGLIADQIGGMGQAGQVMLGQDHFNPLIHSMSEGCWTSGTAIFTTTGS